MTKRGWNILAVVVIVILAIVLCSGSVFAWPQFRLSLVGPQGDTGPAGADGAVGLKGDPGSPGKDGLNGKDADPAVLLQDPAFKALVDEAVATQVAQALASAPANPSVATAEPANVPEPVGAVVTALQNTQDMGQWTVSYYTGATQLMKDFVFTDFIPGWKEFPNVDWPAGNFLAKNGLEHGQALSDFCQQDVTCDFPVAARSFRTITADYNISGIGECAEAGTGIGCAVIIVNVGDVTASYRNQMVDTGHTITGLYWNGDELDQAISAWTSHIVYRMVGIPTSNPANPGANCSVPTGCIGVNLTFAVTSGNELLVLGTAVVKP